MPSGTDAHASFAAHPRRQGLTVLVVDSHRLLAEAVARMLSAMSEINATATATSLPGAESVIRRGRLDVVLIDSEGAAEGALHLLRHLPRDGESLPAVLLFGSCDPESMVTALRAGAAGSLPKDCSVEELRAALCVVASGRRWLPSGLQLRVIDVLLAEPVGAEPASPLDALSARQRDVLGCLVEGMTHAATAERLHVSVNTVRTHVRAMCQTLEVHSTPALVALARGCGLGRDRDAVPRRRPNARGGFVPSQVLPGGQGS